MEVAVFEVDAGSKTNTGRDELLGQLVQRVRAGGLDVDQAALAFTERGKTVFRGTPDLTRYLATHGVSRWTHELSI